MIQSIIMLRTWFLQIHPDTRGSVCTYIPFILQKLEIDYCTRIV
jgi:hypothetical protein